MEDEKKEVIKTNYYIKVKGVKIPVSENNICAVRKRIRDNGIKATEIIREKTRMYKAVKIFKP